MPRGSWLMAHGSWLMAHASWIMLHSSWLTYHESCPVARGSWLVARGSWLMRHGSRVMNHASWLMRHIGSLLRDCIDRWPGDPGTPHPLDGMAARLHVCRRRAHVRLYSRAKLQPGMNNEQS
ncbi:hypothetical protein FCG41_17870 [Azotobacter chroococcum]|nr:hypothetical protein FCG41_17870 [Azotobacter chroococcum]